MLRVKSARPGWPGVEGVAGRAREKGGRGGRRTDLECIDVQRCQCHGVNIRRQLSCCLVKRNVGRCGLWPASCQLRVVAKVLTTYHRNPSHLVSVARDFYYFGGASADADAAGGGGICAMR